MNAGWYVYRGNGGKPAWAARRSGGDRAVGADWVVAVVVAGGRAAPT